VIGGTGLLLDVILGQIQALATHRRSTTSPS